MSDQAKQRAAAAAVALVADGARVGLGTGSTAAIMLRLLAKRVREGLSITGVATSAATAAAAERLGIALSDLDATPRLDLAIDGADEIDGRLNLIKGGGGALLREKIVAACADRVIIIVDASKQVETLGAFTLPLEVVPMASVPLTARIGELGGTAVPRRRDGDAFVTDEGNRILDCDFGPIRDPETLARALSVLPGVIEHGLFVGIADMAIVGHDDGVDVLQR